MINPSAFEMFLNPQQKEALRALREETKGIKAEITIRSDGVEVKLVTANVEAARFLPQIGEQLATGLGQTLHYMFGITGEIVRRR